MNATDTCYKSLQGSYWFSTVLIYHKQLLHEKQLRHLALQVINDVAKIYSNIGGNSHSVPYILGHIYLYICQEFLWTADKHTLSSRVPRPFVVEEVKDLHEKYGIWQYRIYMMQLRYLVLQVVSSPHLDLYNM